MKELVANIDSMHPASHLNIGMPNIQLSTIRDDGRWYNNDGYEQKHINQHRIDIIWNGASEKVRREAKKSLISMYRHGREIFADESITHEIQKTPIDIKIIEESELAVNDFVEFFKGERQSLERKRIHLVKQGSVEAYYGGKIKDGFCDYLGHCISVDRSPSDVATAERMTHENFHLFSPKIFQLVEGERLAPYRLGLKIFDTDGKIKLAETDEAITGELNYQSFKRNIENNPLYYKELEMVGRIKPWIIEVLERKGFDEEMQKNTLSNIYTVTGAEPLLKILEGKDSKNYKIDYLTDIIDWPKVDCKLVSFERSKEWNKFSKLAYKIINQSDGEINNLWGVIKMFARVKFAPNDKFPELLESLKVKIDGILGQGSFEKID